MKSAVFCSIFLNEVKYLSCFDNQCSSNDVTIDIDGTKALHLIHQQNLMLTFIY